MTSNNILNSRIDIFKEKEWFKTQERGQTVLVALNVNLSVKINNKCSFDEVGFTKYWLGSSVMCPEKVIGI